MDENALNKNSHWQGGEEIGEEVAFAMPAPKAWDVRFYQSAPTRGEAVYLVVKTGARSTCVVLRPDSSLGVLDTSKRAFVYGTTSGKEACTGPLGPC